MGRLGRKADIQISEHSPANAPLLLAAARKCQIPPRPDPEECAGILPDILCQDRLRDSPLVVRWSSLTPSLASRALTCLVAIAGDMPSVRPAADKLPREEAWTKTRILVYLSNVYFLLSVKALLRL